MNQRLTGDNQPLLIRLLLQKKGRDAELKRKQLQDKEKSAASKRPASGTPATAKRQAAGMPEFACNNMQNQPSTFSFAGVIDLVLLLSQITPE